jgi:hypothetical protein
VDDVLVHHPQHYTPCATSFYFVIFYIYQYGTLSAVNLKQNYMSFKCGLIPTHYNCNCILVLTTLKMATLVVETWLWLLYNKIAFIKSCACVGLFLKKIVHITKCFISTTALKRTHFSFYMTKRYIVDCNICSFTIGKKEIVEFSWKQYVV